MVYTPYDERHVNPPSRQPHRKNGLPVRIFYAAGRAEVPLTPSESNVANEALSAFTLIGIGF